MHKGIIIKIKNDQRGFINLCIPMGLGFLMLLAAWPAMILDLAFNTAGSLSNAFWFGLGIAIDIIIVYIIGYIFDRRKKAKLHKYFYRIVILSGLLIACGILFALAFTKIGC